MRWGIKSNLTIFTACGKIRAEISLTGYNFRMWNVLLTVNSVLLTIASTYFVYALGTAVVTWTWKGALSAFIIFVVLWISQLALDGINEW